MLTDEPYLHVNVSFGFHTLTSTALQFIENALVHANIILIIWVGQLLLLSLFYSRGNKD